MSQRNLHGESPFRGLADRLLSMRRLRAGTGSAFCITAVHAGEGVSFVTQQLVTAFHETAGSRTYHVALADLRHTNKVGSLRASAQELLTELLRTYEIVLVDCPALSRGSEALALSPIVDGTLLVVQAERTTREEIAAAERSILQAGGTFGGFVLNKAKQRSRFWPFSH